MHFRPEVTVIFRAASVPGKTEWLARISAANNVDWSVMLKRPYVLVDGHVRPVLGQDLAAERVDLAKADGFKPARALQPEAKAADPAEQIQNPKLGDIHDATPNPGTCSEGERPLTAGAWAWF